MTLVFVITVCIKDNVQLRQVIRCVKSIRKFHKERIYMLNDTEAEYFKTIEQKFNDFDNLEIVETVKKGLGELQVFDFIVNCQDIDENDNVVYFHDSTIMLKSFDEASNVNDIKFLWFFTNHLFHWDNTVEEQTPYNLENGIVSHTDSIIDCLKKHYYQNPYFLEWALDAMKNKEKWVGCFGYMCIIKKKALNHMNRIIPFTKTFLKFCGRSDRIINESVFSLICNYFYSVQHCIKSLDGLYFNGYQNSIRGFHTPVEEIDDPLIWSIKSDYMGKISFAR